MIFIAPKVSGGILRDDSEFTKVKGIKDNITYSTLKDLLKENNNLELIHTKSYKHISKGNIELKTQLYSLEVTNSKRGVFYEDSIFSNTKPYNISKDRFINNIKLNIKILEIIAS